MKGLLKFTLAIMLIMYLSSLHLAGEVVKVSNTPGMAELPYIKVMKNGHIMVIYTEGHHFNADGQLYYRILNPETGKWTPDWTKAVARSSSSAYPQLAEDNDGNLHMAYHDGSTSAVRDIYYSMFDFEKQNWKARVKAYDSPGVNSTWPRIALDTDKRMIYIVWSHNYASSVGEMDLTMIENSFDGTWPVAGKSRLTISDTSDSVSIHGDFKYRDGRVYAIWMDDQHRAGNWNIYYNEGAYNEQSGTWSFGQTKRLFPSAGNQYYPALALDDNGDVHILFSAKSNPMFYAKKSGNAWSSPKVISTGGTDQNMFAVLVFKSGLLHSVWRQGKDVYYGRALSDGTWTEPVKIADGQFPGYPGIDVDAKGDAHVVFSDGDPDHPRNIYYTKVELPGKAPTALIKVNKTAGLTPLTVQFDGTGSSDTDGNIVDYRWSFGDGASALGKKISYTYKSAGTYTATLTVIDNDLRAGTDSVQITAHTGEPQAVINVSANTGMRPLTVVFDASASTDYDGTIANYVWDFGDGMGDAGVNVTHVYEGGGDFTAKLTVTDNEGKTGTATQLIEVFEPPVAIFTAQPTVGVPPLVVEFDASASYDPDGEIKTYKWDYGDGLSALSKKETHTYSTAGEFTAYLIVVDEDNYTGTASQIIKVLDKPLPPMNVKVETMTDRAGFMTAYVNHITWEANAQNSGLFTVNSYRVYRKPQGSEDTQYQMLGQVSGTSFAHDDSGFTDSQDAHGFVYAVTAVDDAGNESAFSGLLNSGGTAKNTRREKRFAMTRK